jgi:hypothetical protein
MALVDGAMRKVARKKPMERDMIFLVNEEL